MEMITALDRLAALSQETRLQAFRHLVKAGPSGAPAGDIARVLGVPQNTLSTHLGVLLNAGLVERRREGRSLIYVAGYAAIREVLVYLMTDCCQGEPEIVRPVLSEAKACCDLKEEALP